MQIRNTSGLKRGGPGRKKGIKNKISREMQSFWRDFLTSEEYCANAVQRVIQGKAPHLESFWVAKLEGKPTEHVELAGELAVKTRVVHEYHPE